MKIETSSQLRNSDIRFEPSKFMLIMLSVYFVLSFFEGYLNVFIGSFTKFYIIFLMVLLLFSYKKIRFSYIQFLMIVWLMFKIISTLWAPESGSDILSIHLLSQLGMVAFFVVLSFVNFEEKSVMSLVNASMYSSVFMGILALLFSQPYLGVSSRLTLNLFGEQADPNNLAAFYLVGITIGLYKIFFNNKSKIINGFFIGINAVALGMTASRAGLLSLIMVILCTVFIKNRGEKSIRNLVLHIVLMSAVLLLLYSIAIIFLPVEPFERLFLDDYAEGGWSNRDVIWEYAMYLFEEKPLFGWGWGYYDGSHNTFLTMLIDIGLIGTILFVLSLIKLFVDALVIKKPLVFMLLLTGLMPALSIDAINKRFFWNAIILAVMLINSYVKEPNDD